MRLVDSHVHLYPPEVNQAPEAWAMAQRETHWSVLCTRRRKNGRPVQSFPSLDELLRQMDAGGIERAVLQGWYWESHDTCRLQNRFYAECLRAHPDRISAFATLHPGAGRAEVTAEIAWAKAEGFCGLGELSPHSQGISVNDPVWTLILAEAGRQGLPVNLHVTEENSGPYPGKVSTPLVDFLRMAQANPETNFILAHWGARLPLDPVLGLEARRCANLYYDTAASPLIYRESLFRPMAEVVGAERLLYGSDYPLNLYPKRDDAARLGAMVAELEHSGLTERELSAVAGLNVLNLMKRLGSG